MRKSSPVPKLHPAVPPATIGTAFALSAGMAAVLVWPTAQALGARGTTQAAAAAGFLLAAAGIGILMRRHYPHPRMGACNMVTLLRTALVCALLAPLADGRGAGWAVAAVAMVALVLDGADGWLARRAGLVSRFGARFDMEVDAALALTLCLHVLAGAGPGPEALFLGLARYAFVAAGLALPWMRADLPPRFRRKVVCVLQLAMLILLQTPLLAQTPALWLTRLTVLALLWSFATDILWLWRRRG
ncbi:CDP-alcohol phosphatidyltransferase family protein [Paracoccus benzoatiresistens]|uniref:CDP-alcohol phosphatidyltransferase family protein n=1 Tax=Paracoccus benzoatiresistens TaxID=2997341 RepID=A0ABT4IZ36_9RHOB|nr:CDP-alcohol phosphatidyltransferase family protein [Paracoccus sp. EF6]MCZ0960119.1 CDP-alcohol phosphatidyltransferase family protein [Paracoccus sp. EF6]